MARLDKTIKTYQQHLIEKGVENIPEFIQSILNSDTTKGKYSRFLLDCYLNDKFRIEDLKGGLDSTVGTTISLFHKHKSKLPEDMRSIYKYDSPGSLWNAVKQFDGELSGKEVKREEQDKIYAETEFIYEDENTGFKIVCPLTEDAAKWWGKGTRWCTSAEKNNAFLSYAKQAPLLILFMPGGKKLQLWKDRSNIQFMDAADSFVNINYIKRNWTILEPFIIWLANINYIPKQYRTEQVYKLSVQQNGETLQNVPENMRTEEICKLALKSNGEAFQYIPENMRTEEICKLAIQNNGIILKYIPEKWKTEELCKLAVQSNGYSLIHVPQKIRTKSIYKLAVQRNGGVLEDIPEKWKTEEMCKLAVQQNGNAIQYVPDSFKTKEIIKMAIENDGNALKYIPEQMLTEELCQLAIQKKGRYLAHIPENMITDNLCKIAIQNGCNLLKIPPKYRTEENRNMIEKQTILNNKIYIGKNKIYIEENTIPQEKYQQIFTEIRSHFPEKSLSLKL